MTGRATYGARAGFWAAASAYLLWGFLPLYLHFLAFASPWEILGGRILWSVPVCALLLVLTGGVAEMREALARKGVFWALALSALLIACNWGVYVWSVANAHLMEASLAYFLTPLVNVAMGVALFRERLTPAQTVAIVIAGLGVAIQAATSAGSILIAATLCLSWSFYGLVRKRAPAPAIGGMLAETAILAPFAAGGLLFLAARPEAGEGLAMLDSPERFALMALSGPVTALPLILFGFGAQRVAFSTLGVLQFIAPSIQFAIAAASGEPLTQARLASFALIWVGLVVFAGDAVLRERARRAGGAL